MAADWIHVMDLSQISYEEALTQLRTIVDQLERGSLGLERSLELYEQGVQLTQFCESRLDVVEERMQLLTARGVESRPAPGDAPPARENLEETPAHEPD